MKSNPLTHELSDDALRGALECLRRQPWAWPERRQVLEEEWTRRQRARRLELSKPETP